MNAYQPEVVIAEKVERNVDEFAQKPPVMTGPVVEPDKEVKEMETDTTLELKETDSNSSYWSISGELAKDCWNDNAKIYIGITREGTQTIYEAFGVTGELSDYEYLLYMPKEMLFGEVQFEVMVEAGNEIKKVHSQVVTVGDGQ